MSALFMPDIPRGTKWPESALCANPRTSSIFPTLRARFAQTRLAVKEILTGGTFADNMDVIMPRGFWLGHRRRSSRRRRHDWNVLRFFLGGYQTRERS